MISQKTFTLYNVEETGKVLSTASVTVAGWICSCLSSGLLNTLFIILMLLNHCYCCLTVIILMEAVTFAKENGIVMLTLVPHATHETQPLDTAVHEPLKSNWQSVHSVSPWQIYNEISI